MLDTLFLGVFTDTTRMTVTSDSKEFIIQRGVMPNLEIEHSFAFFSVIIILLIFAILIPVIMIVLDKKDRRLA